MAGIGAALLTRNEGWSFHWQSFIIFEDFGRDGGAKYGLRLLRLVVASNVTNAG